MCSGGMASASVLSFRESVLCRSKVEAVPAILRIAERGCKDSLSDSCRKHKGCDKGCDTLAGKCMLEPQSRTSRPSTALLNAKPLAVALASEFCKLKPEANTQFLSSRGLMFFVVGNHLGFLEGCRVRGGDAFQCLWRSDQLLG